MARVRQLDVVYRPHPAGTTYDNRSPLTTPQAAAALFVPLLENQAQEMFLVALTDSRRKLIGVHEIARGHLDTVDVPIRLIVRAALMTDATGVLLAHNHPSGDPTPSPQDLEITTKIKDACALFEIQVMDHLVIGQGSWISIQQFRGRI